MYNLENRPTKQKPAPDYTLVSKEKAAEVHQHRVDTRRRVEDIKYEKEEW